MASSADGALSIARQPHGVANARRPIAHGPPRRPFCRLPSTIPAGPKSELRDLTVNKSMLAAVAAMCLLPALPADEAKDEVKGKLVLGAKTYEFKNVLAYETTKSGKKRTVIMLTEKPVKLEKLKESFKNKGDDSEFFSFDDNLKLIFDEKGELLQMVIFADPGKNINNIGDENVKADVKFADSRATGTAKMTKADKAFGEEYHFDVTFKVKLWKP